MPPQARISCINIVILHLVNVDLRWVHKTEWYVSVDVNVDDDDDNCDDDDMGWRLSIYGACARVHHKQPTHELRPRLLRQHKWLPDDDAVMSDGYRIKEACMHMHIPT